MALVAAATLAITKFKTRRIRLAIAVIVSGLLFVAFSAASFIARGSIASIDSFSKEGFAGRYITQPQSIGSDEYTINTNKDLIAQAKEQDKKLVADKKAEAKRVGLDYDPNSERLAVANVSKDANNAQGPNQEFIDTTAPQVQAIVHQKLAELSKK